MPIKHILTVCIIAALKCKKCYTMFIIPQLIAFPFVMPVENQDCYKRNVFIWLLQLLKYYNIKKTPHLKMLKYLNSFIKERFDIFSSAVKDRLFKNFRNGGKMRRSGCIYT